MKYFLITLISLGFTVQSVIGQDSITIDKIVTQVGSETILLSEIEEVFAYEKASKPNTDESLKCLILENMMGRKLLVNQAKLDSIIVQDVEVEVEANARVEHILSLMNNDATQFEDYYGISPTEMRYKYREDLKQQIMAERMQASVMSDVKATPKEVTAFFNSIPKDSLPYFNAEVEISEIVEFPKANEVSVQKALDKITSLRNEILNGGDFASLASTWSDDPGSGRMGGELGWQKRGTFVPEFEAVAYNLEKDELSEPVQSSFGFHIIQLIERRGNSINSRHILIKPEITEADVQKTIDRLDSVRLLIMNDSISFTDAVKDYSDENVQSYSNSGRIINQGSQNAFFEIKDLESNIYFAIDSLNSGEITAPVKFKSPQGDQGYRLLSLLSRTVPHQANLSQDYARIESYASENKKAILFNEWLEEKINDTYIRVDKMYMGCPNVEFWLSLSTEKKDSLGKKRSKPE